MMMRRRHAAMQKKCECVTTARNQTTVTPSGQQHPRPDVLCWLPEPASAGGRYFGVLSGGRRPGTAARTVRVAAAHHTC
jgi:hypothetical protein